MTVQTQESVTYDPERVQALYDVLAPDPDLYGDEPAFALYLYLNGSPAQADVFEDSPTAVVLRVLGVPYGADNGQAVTCGPMQFSIDIPEADAIVSLRVQEAAELHAALGALLEEAKASA
jgi:hypothetical protein